MDEFTKEDPGRGHPEAIDELTGRLRQDQGKLEYAHAAVRKSADTVREHWHGKTGEAAAATHDTLLASIIAKHAAIDRVHSAYQAYRDTHEEVKDQARGWVNQLEAARQSIASAATMVKGPKTAPGMEELIALAGRTTTTARAEEEEALTKLEALYETRVDAQGRFHNAITDITDEKHGTGTTAHAISAAYGGVGAGMVVPATGKKKGSGNFGYPLGYEHEYDLGPYMKGKSPEEIFAYIKAHFGQVFPPAGRLPGDHSTRSLKLTHVGQIIHTDLLGFDPGFLSGEIKVTKLTKTSYTIEAMPGHVEYPGTVRFTIHKGPNGDNFLEVRAGYKEALGGNNDLYSTLTGPFWSHFAENIKRGMDETEDFQHPPIPFAPLG